MIWTMAAGAATILTILAACLLVSAVFDACERWRWAWITAQTAVALAWCFAVGSCVRNMAAL